jgi:hypothetical protein
LLRLLDLSLHHIESAISAINMKRERFPYATPSDRLSRIEDLSMLLGKIWWNDKRGSAVVSQESISFVVDGT